jgi:8-oxo-dGTP pyrophosphatase MutT (NUDIX family)
VTEPLQKPCDVELLEVRRLRLVEVDAPWQPPGERVAMDRVWDEAVRRNPSFFDGPVAACAGAAREGTDGLVVSWVRRTYRFYALRRVPGATSWLPPVFVSVVQPTDDGRLLVGRMSSSTAVPGRWLMPGGTMEPPIGEGPLDEAALRRHAARELIEETGVDTPPDDLALWRVARDENGGVGALFLAPPRPASFLRERFAALVAAETALGRDPELDRIAFIRSAADLPGLGGPPVAYLEPVVRCFAGEGVRHEG